MAFSSPTLSPSLDQLFTYDLLQEAFAVEQLLVLPLLQFLSPTQQTPLKRQDLQPPRLEEVVVRTRGSERKKNPQRFSSRDYVDCIYAEKRVIVCIKVNL